MANKCENCTEKCQQAERAHQTALGRMYATNEFTALLKKVESGELVEVVRCKDCKHYMEYPLNKVDKRMCCYVHLLTPHFTPEDGFCSYGERRNDGSA